MQVAVEPLGEANDPVNENGNVDVTKEQHSGGSACAGTTS